MSRFAPRTLVVPFALLLLPAIHGCDDPADPADCLDTGRLQGTVSVGGPPEDVTIRIRSVATDDPDRASYDIHPGEDGTYGLDLPAGDYTLGISPTGSWAPRYDYTAEGLGYGQVPPDTVTIDAATSPVEIDFRLASLDVAVDVSPLFDGQSCEITLMIRNEGGDDTPDFSQDWGKRTIQGGRAEFDLPGVLPGEYRVEIVVGEQGRYWPCVHEGETFWMPGVRDEESAPWYAVGLDSTRTLTAVLAEEPALVEGRVGGAWIDFGLDDAPSVALFTPDSVAVAGVCRVDGDGAFSLPVLAPQPVKIMVYQEGVERWIGGPGFAAATVYDLQPGQVVAGVDVDQCGLRLDARGDKIDLWGPRVRLYDAADTSLVAVASWRYGPDDVAGIPNLWPGDFLLYFTPDEDQLGSYWWRPQWYDRAAAPALAQAVTIGAPGEIVRLDVTLEPGGTIGGRVEAGEVISFYRTVFAAPADGDTSWCHEYIYEGRRDFDFVGLPDGRYRIGITPANTEVVHGQPAPEGTIWYPGTPEWSEAILVEIVDGGNVGGIVVSLD